MLGATPLFKAGAPVTAPSGTDSVLLYSLNRGTNECLSGELVCLPAVVLCTLHALAHFFQAVHVLTLGHQLLAVSYCVMYAYGDELLPDDLRQPRSLEQTDNLAGWVSKDRLDVVCLQIPHPLLYHQPGSCASWSYAILSARCRRACIMILCTAHMVRA